jgi:hypothetical protein
VNSRRAQRREQCKRREEKKRQQTRKWLEQRERTDKGRPVFRGVGLAYEISDRANGIIHGGLGLIHRMVRRLRLQKRIDEQVSVLKIHAPYHESDHVLNIAYNFLADGTRLDDIELLRQNKTYADALRASSIPDPTTAGDFCRRFDEGSIRALMNAINDTRLDVWRQQPRSCFAEALLDVDGTIVPTLGECKQGMGLSYKGIWGYHPLLVSLANTREPLYFCNRSANRPSEEGAAEWLDKAIDLCQRAGFRKITLRGDTAFSQAGHLDRWDNAGVRFIFGYDAKPNLVEIAEELPEKAWTRLERPPRYEVRTTPRGRRENVKEQIVVDRAYQNIRLVTEDVAEVRYKPRGCRKTYRLIVLRKNLDVLSGQQLLYPDIRYFFYITNDRDLLSSEVIFKANDRCDQENLIEQLKNGVRALHSPVDNLLSNWAYMVMAALAWTLKAWFALHLPETGEQRSLLRAEKQAVLSMDFKTFLNGFMRIPAQIVSSGRKIIYRLLLWNRYQRAFLRLVDILETPLRC